MNLFSLAWQCTHTKKPLDRASRPVRTSKREYDLPAFKEPRGLGWNKNKHEDKAKPREQQPTQRLPYSPETPTKYHSEAAIPFQPTSPINLTPPPSAHNTPSNPQTH
jgi:hypothetical protein